MGVGDLHCTPVHCHAVLSCCRASLVHNLQHFSRLLQHWTFAVLCRNHRLVSVPQGVNQAKEGLFHAIETAACNSWPVFISLQLLYIEVLQKSEAFVKCVDGIQVPENQAFILSAKHLKIWTWAWKICPQKGQHLHTVCKLFQWEMLAELSL